MVLFLGVFAILDHIGRALCVIADLALLCDLEYY